MQKKALVQLLSVPVLGVTVAAGLFLLPPARSSPGLAPRPALRKGVLSRHAVSEGFGSTFDGSGTFLFGARPVFPIALSNPPPLRVGSRMDTAGLNEIVRTGVNVFRVGPSWKPWTVARVEQAREWDAAAARRGVYTWINLNGLARATPGWRVAARLRATVLALLTGPSSRAIALWKGADEPGFRHIRPASLVFAYCRVTSRGQRRWCDGQRPLDRHRLWVTIESAKAGPSGLAAYSKVTDTHGVDVYPITIRHRSPDLHLVGIWTRRLAAITPDRSVWTTLQICASGSYALRTGRYLLPTRWQERYMVYDAIVNGARGLAFYGGNNSNCWNPHDLARRWNWTFWRSTLAPIVRQISGRSPLGPALLNPSSTRDLAANDPSTEAISRIAPDMDGMRRLWVIAARAGSGNRTVTITGLPTTIRNGYSYPDGHRIDVVHGTLTDRFRQWQVHVYRFPLGLEAPPDRSRVSGQAKG